MKKTLILGLIAMMALMVNAQDQKKCTGDKKCKTEKCEKKACDKTKKCEKKDCCKAKKASRRQTHRLVLQSRKVRNSAK